MQPWAFIWLKLSAIHLLNACHNPVCRMKEGQTGIYYMAADSMAAAASAPFVEKLVQKGYEVRCRRPGCQRELQLAAVMAPLRQVHLPMHSCQREAAITQWGVA